MQIELINRPYWLDRITIVRNCLIKKAEGKVNQLTSFKESYRSTQWGRVKWFFFHDGSFDWNFDMSLATYHLNEVKVWNRDLETALKSDNTGLVTLSDHEVAKLIYD